MGLEVRVCTFEELEADWRRLEEEGVIKLPYLTYDWQYIWWKHYKWRAKKLLLLGAYDHGRLEAIAPLWLGEMRIKGRWKIFDRISLVGARETDYGGFIHRNEGQRVAENIFRYLKENYPQSVIYLCDIRPEDIGTYDTTQANMCLAVERGSIFPYIALPNEVDSYFRSLGGSTRKDLRVKMNRLKRLKEFRIEKSNDPIRADQLFRLHYARWRMDPKDPVLEVLENYERDLIKTFCHRKIMKFISLFDEGSCLGTILVYDFCQVRYYHKMGYDTSYGRYSPGNILLYLSIEDAIEVGFREYDLLRGEEEYKWHFTSQSRACYNLMAADNNLRLALFRILR